MATSSLADLIVRTLLEDSVVVEKEYAGRRYKYVVLPLGEYGRLRPEVLLAMASEMLRVSRVWDADAILVPEAMGIHIGALMSVLSGKPLVIARKRGYGLPGEIEVVKETGYERSYLYINGLEDGESILLADILISTGGTLTSLIKALTARGFRIADAVVLIEKPRYGGVKRVLEETGVRVKTLIRLYVDDQGVRVEPTELLR